MKYTSLFIIILAFSCVRQSDSKFPDLVLGESVLHQEIEHEELVEGLHFYKILRGEASDNDFYTLSSGVISQKKKIELVEKLSSLDFLPRVESPAESGPHEEYLGDIIRVGKYKTLKEAVKIKAKLQEDGIHMAVRYTAEDGKPTSGPFNISLLEINLNVFKGSIFSGLGKEEVKGKEYTSSIANRHKALAAVNAGFFAWKKEVGIVGEPAGISIINGELVSEATEGRAALVIDNTSPRRVFVAHNLRNELRLLVGDTVFNIHGINRAPGKILNCGNKIDSTSTIPIHDFVCYNPNEIIVFNRKFGESSHKGKGFEFIIDENGKITSTNNKRGDKIPDRGYLIQATGTYVKHLENLLEKEAKVSVKIRVMSDEGEIALREGVYVVNGGPTLLYQGEIEMASRYKEGFETRFGNFKVSDAFVDEKDKAAVTEDDLNNRHGFYNGWVIRRHPRTAVGITKDNKVYIAVVYGRQPKITAGASITEMALLMKSLGCHEAFNLDGGGSSMMVVKGKKTGKSSDLEGERAVGDALIITN